MEVSTNGALAPVESLPEPDLSYYLSLRAQYHAAQVSFHTWQQALQVMTVDIMQRYGLRPEDGIDPRGRFIRAPREEATAEGEITDLRFPVERQP
jgi:hypothetical protein